MGRIITVKEFKDFLQLDGSAEDGLIISLIDAVSTDIERRTGRTFKERTGLVEFYDSKGGRKLFSRRRPITTTTTLELRVDPDHEFTADDDLIEETGGTVGDFTLDRNIGLFTLVGTRTFNRGPQIIRLTYSAGYTVGNIPDEAKLAAAYMVGFMLQKFRDKGGLTHASKSMPQGTTTFLNERPAIVDQLLQPFKLIDLGVTTGRTFGS